LLYFFPTSQNFHNFRKTFNPKTFDFHIHLLFHLGNFTSQYELFGCLVAKTLEHTEAATTINEVLANGENLTKFIIHPMCYTLETSSDERNKQNKNVLQQAKKE
jgi:hypothetical protein